MKRDTALLATAIVLVLSTFSVMFLGCSKVLVKDEMELERTIELDPKNSLIRNPIDIAPFNWR